jgi:bacteriophage N4 adsorption protein B
MVMDFVENTFIVLAYVAVIGFLINGLDDLLFDSQFLVYLWRKRKKPRVSLKDLKLAPEQWIAIFVPAWLEGGVVNRMAEYASRVVLYEKYDIFIGVYPNDPETNRCVDELCAQNPRIHKVLVPHGGPTSKADCLNWIYRAMRLNEVPRTREYQLIAIHDAEDVLHPLVLKVYNYFIPRVYDMGQVPVFALELPVWRYWTGNVYVDDFAELHTKDLFIREAIGGVVPSAGVGTVFGRKALDRMAADNNGEPFRVGNLTEDYEIAIRLKRAGFRAGILNVPVERIVHRKRRDGSLGPPETVTEVVAVRESFPKTLMSSIRQRSRWILGISFQTWEQAGWAGSLPMRYTLFRDRRAPLSHLINVIGYVVLAGVLFQWWFQNSAWGAQYYVRPLIQSDSLLFNFVIIDTLLLGYRVAQKAISVQQVYNWKQALFSIPRTVLGNIINFSATIRASRMYIAHKLFGRPIVWLKTAHVFPREEELAEFTKTIEDLLIEDGLVTREQIEQALRLEQPRAGRYASAPLCLLRMGLLDEKQFTGAWARHSRLRVRVVNPYEIPDALLRQFPEQRSLDLHAVPAEMREGSATIAFREPPDKDAVDRLARQLDMRIRPVLARPSNLEFTRDVAYPRLALPPSRLAANLERFRQAARLQPANFLELLSNKHASTRSLPDVLIDSGALNEADARRLWAETIGCPPLDVREFPFNQEIYFRIGPSFWWLHRMLPITPISLATSAPPHPQLALWLSQQLRATPNFIAELPSKLEFAQQRRGMDIDPDQVLLDYLTARGLVKREEAAQIKATREVIADPLPRWLLLQRTLSAEQLHRAFLDICYLPPATPWTTEEIRRLQPVLPPGFAEEHGCYCLEEAQGAIRMGLAQMPSKAVLNQIYDRLAGYPLFFQALSYAEAFELRG